ncbi:MAG: hypothetical protein A3K04_04685 [Gallionellales bacterium RBG_16_56_9]|nr:MAG: hypothetical protein A3K04_04685 [Gallionellales bacterium RBG_16_56_9]
MPAIGSIQLYAPDTYPTKRAEIRAYTIAAFRVSQQSDQLSLVAMPKAIVDFLIKGRAIGYWNEKRWLTETPDGYRLTAEGLVICQSALAEQLPTHNTTARNVEYWVNQFRHNTKLPRSAAFGPNHSLERTRTGLALRPQLKR